MKLSKFERINFDCFEGVNCHDYVQIERVYSGDWHLLVQYNPDLAHTSRHETWADAVRVAEQKTTWEIEL